MPTPFPINNKPQKRDTRLNRSEDFQHNEKQKRQEISLEDGDIKPAPKWVAREKSINKNEQNNAWGYNF